MPDVFTVFLNKDDDDTFIFAVNTFCLTVVVSTPKSNLTSRAIINSTSPCFI